MPPEVVQDCGSQTGTRGCCPRGATCLGHSIPAISSASMPSPFLVYRHVKPLRPSFRASQKLAGPIIIFSLAPPGPIWRGARRTRTRSRSRRSGRSKKVFLIPAHRPPCRSKPMSYQWARFPHAVSNVQLYTRLRDGSRGNPMGAATVADAGVRCACVLTCA